MSITGDMCPQHLKELLSCRDSGSALAPFTITIMAGACPCRYFSEVAYLPRKKVGCHSSNSCWSNALSSGFEMRQFLRRRSPTLAVRPSPTWCRHSRWMRGHPFSLPIPPKFGSSIFLNCTPTVTHHTVKHHSSISDHMSFYHRKYPNKVIHLACSCFVTPYNGCLYH